MYVCIHISNRYFINTCIIENLKRSILFNFEFENSWGSRFCICCYSFESSNECPPCVAVSTLVWLARLVCVSLKMVVESDHMHADIVLF